MPTPKDQTPDPEPAEDGVLQRTDNSFAGKKPDERLIGTDIPDDEQDAEDEEEED
ncbi:hypothetical protein VQ042_20470 [Aurantimonas sp. A2-1-M11]|uniref:hypothetical protein n=1 Tax=Aurantimonas sp. A2-1-M11 TaxID=3113712 RepID=UPI002F92D497